MIRWFFIFILSPLCWGEASVQIHENESAPAQEQNVLILVDLQGALFYPKTTGAKVASIQNQQVAVAIKNYQQQHGAKILYLAEHSSEAMFWQSSVTASHLPFERSFSLDSQAFGGFEGSIPSCRNGIVLCQGQPLGEILGLVLNQLSVWTQFSPKKILFYTVSKQRGEIVSVIGSRIGALVEVNLVHGVVGIPPALEVKPPIQTKITPPVKITLQPKKQKSIVVSETPKPQTKPEKEPNKVEVTTAKVPKTEPSKSESPKEIPQKVNVAPVEITKKPANESTKPGKEFPPIKIDESLLEHV